MRVTKVKMLGLGLAVLVVAALGLGAAYVNGVFKYPSTGGDISPYSVGFYDFGEAPDGEVTVEVVNPTPYDLVALIFRVGCDGQLVSCVRRDLSPNEQASWEFDCPRPESGAIKVLSVKPPYPAGFVYAQAGVVGWVRHELEGYSNGYVHPGGISDSSMVALPSDLLTANSYYEFNKLLDFASQNCALDLQ